MKITGIILYCITFTTYGVLLSDSYVKFNISHNIWLVITAAATIVLAADLIYENFFQKQ
jgi:hypothetical protein